MLKRNYKAGDEEGLVKLFNLAFSEYGLYLRRSKEEWVWRYKRYPNFLPEGVFIAEDNHKIVGSVIATKRDFNFKGKKPTCFMIDDVATHPQYRGQGIARTLEEKAISLASKSGIPLLSAYTEPGSTSEGIFKSLGFKVLSQPQILVKPINLPKLVLKYLFDLVFLSFQQKRKKESPPLVPSKEKRLAPLRGFFLTGQGNLGRFIEKGKRYHFQPYSPKILADIVRRINEAGENLLGFAPRDLEYFSWRRLEKPNFLPSDLVLLEDGNHLDVLILSFHNFLFTKSKKRMLIASLDELIIDDESFREQSLALLQEGIRRAKRRGAVAILSYVDPQDFLKVSLLRSLGFWKIGSISALFREVKDLGLDKAKSRWYIASESILGEP